ERAGVLSARAADEDLLDAHRRQDARAVVERVADVDEVARALGLVAAAGEALRRALTALDVAPDRLRGDAERPATPLEAQVELALDVFGRLFDAPEALDALVVRRQRLAAQDISAGGLGPLAPHEVRRAHADRRVDERPAPEPYRLHRRNEQVAEGRPH